MGEIKINPLFNVHENYNKVNIVNPYRFGETANPTASYLADAYPTTALGWFPFRISFAFDKCLRLRRSSDNAETDVLTDINPATYISLSSMTSDGITLGAWIGSSDGFVRTAYDMTGNGYDYINTTPSSQPKFIAAGVVITDPGSGKPAIYGNIGNDMNALMNPMPVTGDITLSSFTIGRGLTIDLNYGLFSLNPSASVGSRVELYLSDENSQRGVRYFGGNALFNSVAPAISTIQKSVFKTPNTAPTYFENGVQRTKLGGSAGQNLDIKSDSAFRFFGGNGFNPSYTATGQVEGYIGGAIYYFSDKSVDREAIETFINV